jgi:hypothetical protein
MLGRSTLHVMITLIAFVGDMLRDVLDLCPRGKM